VVAIEDAPAGVAAETAGGRIPASAAMTGD
jgi:hypothetical protein